MIPASFEYVRATDVGEALAALAEHGDEAKLLAGGHSLVPLMKLRLATPAVLVDVGGLRDLSYVKVDGDEVAVGALTRHGELERSSVLAAELPILAGVAHEVGDPQVRHRGTLGGSLAHGDPASDLPAVAACLGATLVVEGPAGRRTVAASDFFTGFLETALAPDEMLVEVRFPRRAGLGWNYQKFNRRAQDWAIVGVAAVARPGGGADVALVNMATTPVKATGVEDALAAGASAADASEAAADGTSPPSDLNATEGYRRHLAQVLTRRALVAAGLS